jgi:U3 small nucleolar RNA-associated protein 18
MLTGGLDKTLRFFQIDGKTNPKIQSIYFQDMPIYSAEFLADGKEVIVSGRRKFFYFVDIERGQVEKVPQIQGKRGCVYLRFLYQHGIITHILGRTEESLEKFALSPDGAYISFLGKNGYIVLVSAKSKQWIANLKTNGSIASISYSTDNKLLYSLGGKCLYSIIDQNRNLMTLSRSR